MSESANLYISSMNRLGIFLFSMLVLAFGCNHPQESSSPATDTLASEAMAPPSMDSLPKLEGFIDQDYALEMEATLEGLYKKSGHKVLEGIKAIDLFSYLSGFYTSGHPFPIIYLDRKAQQFTVTHKAFQAHYPIEKQDEALESYFDQLVEHGYEINGRRKENYSTIKIDGEERVVMRMSDLFPDQSTTKKHFSQAQYEFIYNELNAIEGLAYLSGYGNNGRNFPLMAGTGFQSTARLNLLGPGMAMEFSFDDLDLAFDKYEEYLRKGN